MKVRVCILFAAGLMICNLAGQAQTNGPSAEAAAPAEASATTNSPVPPGAAIPPIVPAEGSATTNSPVPSGAAIPLIVPAEGSATTNSLVLPGAVIPLIVYDDVPLTDAIRNLARMAGLNFMLDPKLGFGQPGPDGRMTPQPTVTVRWENITAEQALNALLGNHNLQLVEDPKTKIARITAKEPGALPPLVTRVVQLRYTGPLNMLTNVQGALTDKRSKVLSDVRTSQLVVIATEAELAAVEELVERLDTVTKQVLIEARLIEIVLNPSSTHGVDWSGTLQGQNIAFGNGVMSGSSQTSIPGAATTTTLPGGRTITSSPGSSTATSLSSILGGGGLGWNTISGFTPAAGFLNADGVHAVLSLLNSYAETKVLSAPRTVTLDNELAVIEVGTMFPIVNTTAGTANTTGGSQITYSNLTVRLEVTPRISANDSVHLKVVPKILRLGDQIKTTVGGVENAVYEFNKRELNTTVMIPSGNTLVMGGLIEDDIHRANVKVPLLGDIPGLGFLFRSDTQTRTKSNLIIFITPTIVGDDDFQPTKTTYLKTPLPSKDAFEDDWTSWNSGQPKDWSKPKKEAQKPEPPKPVFDESAVQRSSSSASTSNSIP